MRVKDAVYQHRGEIHFSVRCKNCGYWAYYTPVEEYVDLPALCSACLAEVKAAQRHAWRKSFKNAEQFLINPSLFSHKP